MNRKLVVLNVLLAALLVWLGVQIRAAWMESKAREAAALQRQAKPATPATPPPVAGVEPVQAANYQDVAQRTLFSQDRDSTVILEPPPTPPPPPPPPPEKPVPPLPSYHGQMSFGAAPVILLSTEKLPQKSYRQGDKVGEFQIAEFDSDTVTFEWNEKTLVNNLKDLTPKEPERPVQRAAATNTSAKAASVASISKMGAAPAQKSDPALGPPNGMYRSCVDSDTSPDGTVKDGYVKKIVQTLMGRTCQWEPIR